MSGHDNQQSDEQDQSGYGATEENDVDAPPQEQPQRPEQAAPHETPGEIRQPGEFREPIELPKIQDDPSETEEPGPGRGAD